MEKLTIQEEEVMLYIWSIGDCFVKEMFQNFLIPNRHTPQSLPLSTT